MPPTKLAERDTAAVACLRAAHEQHPFYGVHRLALHLGWSQDKARRIRTKAGIVVPTASKKRRSTRGNQEIAAPQNILQRYARFKDELRPQDGMTYGGMVHAHA